MDTVVYDFWAPTCGPCRVFGPEFERWAAKYADRARFVKVDVSKDAETATKYSVSAIPTVVVERDGELVKKFVGAPRESDVVALL